MCATLLFEAMNFSEGFPWGIYTSSIDPLEEFKGDEIALKFTEMVVEWSVNKVITKESFLPQVQAFLKYKPFEAGARYYWIEHVSSAFLDFGIVMVDAKLRNLVYLHFMNDQ